MPNVRFRSKAVTLPANALIQTLSTEHAESDRIRADPVRLKQVLLNLLSNAIKFTPSGGQITLAAIPVSEFVEISITDTGIGIASADLENVVKPFFQVDSELNRNHDGTGLGLAITVRLLESMGGDALRSKAPWASARAP